MATVVWLSGNALDLHGGSHGFEASCRVYIFFLLEQYFNFADTSLKAQKFNNNTVIEFLLVCIVYAVRFL